MLHPKIRKILDSEYTVVGKLGEGGYATVYLGKRSHGKDKGKRYALKVSEHTIMASHDEPLEVRIMSQKLDKEPFFVECIGYVAIDTSSMIVLEYCKEGDLHSLNEEGQLSQAFIWHVFLCAARAIDSAHRNGVIHRDIKPSNFLLKYPKNRKQNIIFPQVKLADWGVSAVKTDRGYSPYSDVGTPSFRPKDIKGLADEKCDVWAVGATIHTLIFKRGVSAMGVPDRYDGRICERSLYDLMAQCLLPHHYRISSDELKVELENLAPPRIREYYERQTQIGVQTNHRRRHQKSSDCVVM